jgi:hypothetical protein
VEIMDQITEGLVDEDNVKDGGKIINKLTYPAPHLSVGAPFQDQEDACTQGITPEQRPPEWNLVPKEENQQDQPDEKEKGQPMNRIDASHREKIYPKPEEKSKIPDQRQLFSPLLLPHGRSLAVLTPEAVRIKK